MIWEEYKARARNPQRKRNATSRSRGDDKKERNTEKSKERSIKRGNNREIERKQEKDTQHLKSEKSTKKE